MLLNQTVNIVELFSEEYKLFYVEVDESERRREEDHSNSMYFCKESFRASIAAVGSILEVCL